MFSLKDTSDKQDLSKTPIQNEIRKKKPPKIRKKKRKKIIKIIKKKKKKKRKKKKTSINVGMNMMMEMKKN